jgi:uncharacterized protein
MPMATPNVTSLRSTSNDYRETRVYEFQESIDFSSHMFSCREDFALDRSFNERMRRLTQREQHIKNETVDYFSFF